MPRKQPDDLDGLDAWLDKLDEFNYSPENLEEKDNGNNTQGKPRQISKAEYYVTGPGKRGRKINP
jgi:hypothetical protein